MILSSFDETSNRMLCIIQKRLFLDPLPERHWISLGASSFSGLARYVFRFIVADVLHLSTEKFHHTVFRIQLKETDELINDGSWKNNVQNELTFNLFWLVSLFFIGQKVDNWGMIVTPNYELQFAQSNKKDIINLCIFK